MTDPHAAHRMVNHTIDNKIYALHSHGPPVLIIQQGGGALLRNVNLAFRLKRLILCALISYVHFFNDYGFLLSPGNFLFIVACFIFLRSARVANRINNGEHPSSRH